MADARDSRDQNRAPGGWASQREASEFFGVRREDPITLEAEDLLSPLRDGHRRGCVCRYWLPEIAEAIAARAGRSRAKATSAVL